MSSPPIASKDEPTKAMALFIKETEDFLRCYYGAKISDFYLMEQERHGWLGAFSLCGKRNYVAETFRSIEEFYGVPNKSDKTNLTNYDREEIRCNRFNTTTKNGHAQTYDELNEGQMVWNKGCAKTYNFDTVRRSLIVSRDSYILICQICTTV